MSFSLTGKTILLFAPKFFGYEQDVITELKSRDAYVDFLPDRPVNGALAKGLLRLEPRLFQPYADKFYSDWINAHGQDSYDYILIQSGESISEKIISLLKIKYKSARLIFYTYDSISNKKGQLKKLHLFDACFTFDQIEAKKYGLAYRPLFFSQGFENDSNSTIKFDISFVGTVHSDRYEIISKINQQLPNGMRSFWHMYLQAKWLYWIRKILGLGLAGSSMNEFKFSSINKSEVQDIFFSSKVVLDIEHPKQNGLTMRTFESLGSRKKLITTNQNILVTDFYNPDNILVIDRKNPIIDVTFFQTPYYDIPAATYNKYKLSAWVDEVFGLTTKL